MAVPAAIPSIVWRNPRFVQPRRRWAKLEREPNRNLYVVLEALSVQKNTWDGLPTLEMIRGGANAKKDAVGAPVPDKRHSLWFGR